MSKRWPTWAAVALVLVGAAVAAIVLTEHGKTTKTTAVTTAREVKPTASGGECSSERTTSAIEVTFYGGETGLCEAANRGFAKSGQYWQVVDTVLRVHPLCSLARQGVWLEVRFGGLSESEAEQLCAYWTAHGWTAGEGPGERREAQEAQQAAEQKAAKEAREDQERAEARRAREAEQRQEEAKLKREQAEQEAQAKREQEKAERENHEAEHRNEQETHRSEEEAARSQREAEGSH